MKKSSSDRNVVHQWRSFARLPAGRWMFSKMLGITVPYTGSIDARVDSLAAGHALVHMTDRRSVRNHLQSIHAVALTHLAELTANLALMTRQKSNGRWIVTGMEVKFLKKARGTIKAQALLPDVDWNDARELVGYVELRDDSGEIVMTAQQHWRIGPKLLKALN